MHKKDKHHVIPISMKWPDDDTNIAKLWRADHNLVHEKLNVTHHLLRNFRRETNEYLIWDKEKSREYHKIWKQYFMNLNKLPEHLVQEHNISFARQLERLDWRVEKMVMKLEIPKPYDIDNSAFEREAQDSLKYNELVEATEWKLYNLIMVDGNKNDLFIEYYLWRKLKAGKTWPSSIGT
jgi:hypothetical protein